MATKTKSKPQVNLVEQASAPIETAEQRNKRIIDAMYKKDPPKEMREAFRELLKQQPDLAYVFGTLPSMARGKRLDSYESFPALEESLRFQIKKLRADLAGEQATPLELLLVDAVVLCYTDYFSFALLMNTHTSKQVTLDSVEQWDRILAGKEARYLRAIGELARVRRLLNLPAPQVNINLPGGQQVNVAGSVTR